MVSFFSEKKKLFAFLAVILIVIIIPLTVIVSRQQQEIRQRASGQQTSLYFASSGNCNKPLASISLTPDQFTPLSLCLRAGTDYTFGISGFNIALSASNSLIFQSANTTADADKFGSEPSPQILNGNKTIHFTRIRTDHDISDTILRVLDFTVRTTVAENGSITITTAEIVSLSQDPQLTVESSVLSYNSAPSSPTSTQLATSSLCNPACKDNETCLPYDDPGGLSGYSCSPKPTSTPPICGSLGQTCCSSNTPAGECFQLGTFCSGNNICTTVKTPTPTPIIKRTNCGNLLCKDDQKCLIQQAGQGEEVTYSCITSAPTPTPTKTLTTKKTEGQTCFYTTDCAAGLTCDYYEELGYGTCVSSIPTPTKTPTPTLTSTPTLNPTRTPTPTLTPTVIVCLPKSKGNADNSACPINDEDYEIWKAEFISQTGTRADFDGDGQVTILDFNIWYQFRGI